MPPSLSEDEVDEIMEVYEEEGTYQAVGEELDYDPETVSKYVKQRQQQEEDDDAGTSTEGPPEGYTAEPPEGSKPSGSSPDKADFVAMDPGDFIEWFFDHGGFGVYENFAKNLAQNCRLRDEIPDQHEMANRLMTMKSGINSDSDAGMIAENYWRVAQRWMDANSRGGGGGGYRGPSGEWVSGEQQPAGDGGTQNGGGFVSPDQQQPAANGGQRQGGYGQNPRGQGGQRPPGRDQEIEQLREEIKEMKEVQMRQVQQQSNREKQEVQTVKDKFQEVVELQKTLDQLQSNDDGPDEAVKALQAQIEDIRNELAQQAKAGGDDGGMTVQGDDDGIAVMAQLAMQDNVDPETLGVLADAMGTTDPEVKKAEFDYKKTQEKLENRKETVDAVFENISDTVDGSTLAGLLSAMMSSDEDDEDAEGGEDGGQQRPSDAGGGAQQATTRPAGSEDLQQGEIQIVGDDDQGAEAQQEEAVSPAQRRYSETFGDGGNTGMAPRPDELRDADEEDDSRVGDIRTMGGED